jgi:hypothetical protein
MILSVYLRRRQTRLFIEIRVPYEKVIPYKPTYQKSLGSHSNRFPYFDVKYIYNYQVMAWLWHHLIIIIIMRRPIPAHGSPPFAVNPDQPPPHTPPLPVSRSGALPRLYRWRKPDGYGKKLLEYFHLFFPYPSRFLRRTFSLVAEGHWGVEKSC